MDIVLIAAALLPAIALMLYVYKKDKAEPEPIGLVMRVFFLGAASGIVAGIVESILIGGVEGFMPDGLLRLFIEYFICVALVEELCKFGCLNTVKKNPEFNYVFDAVVYSVAAALGFAALENVFYVLDGGLETALVRAILSVPGHAADGVVMGVFYGLARQHELHGRTQKARTFYILSIALPVIEHGFYDAALSTENDFMALLAMVFDLAFIALAFVLVRRTAKKDEPLHPNMARTNAPASMPSAMPGTPAPPMGGYAQQQAPQAFGQQQPPQAFGQPQAQGQQQPAPQAFVQQQVAQPPSNQQATWFCLNCGRQNTSNFCTGCGAPRQR